MNARGLMELVVLNIGLEMGVISPVLFSMMVLMAIVTTMSAAPLLRLFLGDPARTRRLLDTEPDAPLDSATADGPPVPWR